MIGSQIVLWAGWAFYCYLHSALATSVVRNTVVKRMSWTQPGYRVAYNIQATLLLVMLVYYQFRAQSNQLYNATLLTNVIGVSISVLGLMIMISCIYKYFKQLSGLQGERTRDELEIGGLHRLVRHPLYLGTFIFLTGILIIFPSVKNLGTVSIIIGYTLIAIRFEEKKLVGKFGRAYQDYQQNVPMIIPKIKN